MPKCKIGSPSGSSRSIFERRYLGSIEPSFTQLGVRYYPVSLVLTDGSALPKAVIMSEVDASQEFNLDHLEMRRVAPSEVSEVKENPAALPRKLVNRINKVCETAQSSIAFIARTKKDEVFSFWGPSPLPGDIDFLELPSGVSPGDISSVEFIGQLVESSLPAAHYPDRKSIALCLL